jgi:hypothetical protein
MAEHGAPTGTQYFPDSLKSPPGIKVLLLVRMEIRRAMGILHKGVIPSLVLFPTRQESALTCKPKGISRVVS